MKRNSMLRSIIAGGGCRPTRFHDEEGNMVPLAAMWYLPHAVITTMLRKAFGYRPPQPWFSYRAQRKIAQILLPDSAVVEFGSGMSTLWFAKRCALLYSIEHNPVWYARVKSCISAQKINNVRYFLRDKSCYAELSCCQDRSLDFILIDGIERPACVQTAEQKIKRGGWIYLDNTDRMEQAKSGNEYQQAEQLLFEIVQRCHGTFEYFTDFVPTTLVAKQGMLVHL